MEEQMDILIHDGVAHDENPPGRGSGRYPWGSGDKPFQHPRDFLQRTSALRAMGMSEKDVASAVGIFSRDSRRQYEGSPKRLRTTERIARHEEKLELIRDAKALADQGVKSTQGARILGLPNESSFRALLKDGTDRKAREARETADDLLKIMEAKGKGLQVGEGVAQNLGITQDRLDEALELLYFDGYEIWNGRVPQPNNPDHQTTVKILYPPGTPNSAPYDYNSHTSIMDQYFAPDGKHIEEGFQYPASMDSKRLMVRWPDEGGADKDGLVELRPGVKDLYLGDGVHYSQVRILVDGTHFIKGMAAYGDPKDFPDGVDVIFNTTKAKGTPVMSPNKDDTQVLKPIKKDDPTNPFNSAIKEHGGQSYWEDDKGEKHLSLINKRADEGDWGDWSKSWPSQFLAKQPKPFVDRQLAASKKEQREELDKILSLTNDTLKKKLLEDYADATDTKAVKLKAVAVKDSMYQVLLPVPSLADDEIYAPNYTHGETVSLVRFPHAGQFEIATLRVNNDNPEGNRLITKNAKDAIGVNKATLNKLSGADTDGDTALVIPHRNGVVVSSRDALPGLKTFDMELEYGDHPGNTHLKEQYKQKQMGIVSNLLFDMNQFGASDEEVERATKYSMVIIDAVKHKYDWKQCYKDNDIDGLKKRWQKQTDENGRVHYGAATLLTKAKSPITLPGRFKDGQWYTDPETGKTTLRTIDPETGKKLQTFESTEYTVYQDPITKERLFKSDTPGMLWNKDHDKMIPESIAKVSTRFKPYKYPAMKLTDDAMTLVSDRRTPIELAYADYANYLKGLANEARKATLSLKPMRYNPDAARVYKTEVESLKKKYLEFEKRKPLELDANVQANSMIKGWDQENPHASSEERSKAKQKILNLCRRMRGLTSYKIDITPKEWEAIQAGAIGSSTFRKLLQKVDSSIIMEYAMPSTHSKLTPTQIGRIKSMAADPKNTNAMIAEALGINVSTVIKYLEGGGSNG